MAMGTATTTTIITDMAMGTAKKLKKNPGTNAFFKNLVITIWV